MTTAVDPVLEGMRPAIRLALDQVMEYDTGSAPGEIADHAWDQLEGTHLLTRWEAFEAEGRIIREVLWVLGLDGGASDASHITQAQLVAAARRMDNADA